MQSLKSTFGNLYGTDNDVLRYQKDRFLNIKKSYEKSFGKDQGCYFSTPGRIEIVGNHTDHNHGRILAASINLDSIAFVSPNNSNRVYVYSKGFPEPFIVDLQNLNVKSEEKGTTNALIRGIAAGFLKRGLEIGGFNACIDSDVLPGSGLSSSASVEVLFGTIFSFLYNNSTVSAEDIAKIGQYAENEYFGKPCGLMDQMACAVGGIISIDFKNPHNPNVKKVDYNFNTENYNLLVLDTGGNHADLTEDYASVPAEMKAVAQLMGVEVLRDISEEQFYEVIPEIRERLGDRAVLRTLHFISENNRVPELVKALEAGDFSKFLSLVKASGNSSFKWLQNIFTTKNTKEQGISLALALTEAFLKKIQAGACRVHGGGFAGTILVLLPKSHVSDYVHYIEKFFGECSVTVLTVREQGTVYINEV